MPDCVRAFASGSPVRIRNPAATRPWQHVLEPLCGYLLVAETMREAAEAARAWNFDPGADNVATVGDVVALVAEAWGGSPTWSADPGPHPHEAGLLAVDASQARQHLSWKPRLDLRQSVTWAVDWYKCQLAGEDVRLLIQNGIERYETEIA
ncbi:MAG: hypothetical protein ACJ8AI_07470 [Rhodopila sp.]